MQNEVKTNEVAKLSREIFVTIMANSMPEPKTFKTAAVTLGDLKQEMLAHNINFEGQTFQEGYTVTELLNDHAVLPRVDKNGLPIDELLILMTGSKKKFNSGNVDFSGMSRQALVTAASTFVKQNPQYKAEFGNVSSTKSTLLVELMNKYANNNNTTAKKDAVATVKETVVETAIPATTTPKPSSDITTPVGKLAHAIFNALADFCMNLPTEQQVTILKTSFTDEQLEGFKKILSIKN